MTNFYKLIRDKKVKTSVENRTLILTTPSGKVVEFVPDGKDCFVEYNVGALGGGDREKKKQSAIQRILAFFERFFGIG